MNIDPYAYCILVCIVNDVMFYQLLFSCKLKLLRSLSLPLSLPSVVAARTLPHCHLKLVLIPLFLLPYIDLGVWRFGNGSLGE